MPLATLGILVCAAVFHSGWNLLLSYVGSIREVSIVFGALMGWHFLGEKFGLVRVIGAGLIFAGIVIFAVLG